KVTRHAHLVSHLQDGHRERPRGSSDATVLLAALQARRSPQLVERELSHFDTTPPGRSGRRRAQALLTRGPCPAARFATAPPPPSACSLRECSSAGAFILPGRQRRRCGTPELTAVESSAQSPRTCYTPR